MKAKCFAFVLCFPVCALAECLVEAEGDRELELFETAQQAWIEYRDATCELFAERDQDERRAQAMATCLEFYARQRELELRIMSRVLTFTNVRSILAVE